MCKRSIYSLFGFISHWSHYETEPNSLFLDLCDFVTWSIGCSHDIFRRITRENSWNGSDRKLVETPRKSQENWIKFDDEHELNFWRMSCLTRRTKETGCILVNNKLSYETTTKEFPRFPFFCGIKTCVIELKSEWMSSCCIRKFETGFGEVVNHRYRWRWFGESLNVRHRLFT